MSQIEDTVMRLARTLDQRRLGKFRAVVADNQDPETRGRLKLRIAAVLGDQDSDWALPCVPLASAGSGLFAVPEVGAQVWAEFEEGDISRPLWVGGFWAASGDVPSDAALTPPSTVLLRTAGGHMLVLADKSGSEEVRLAHSGGASLVIDANAGITLTDANGATVKLDANAGTLEVADANGNQLKLDSAGAKLVDANGNQVEMAASGVTVKGQQIVLQGSQVMLGGAGGEPLIKGTSFLTLFATHMHPTAMGPSGPPIPQGEMSSLSSKVMVA